MVWVWRTFSQAPDPARGSALGTGRGHNQVNPLGERPDAPDEPPRRARVRRRTGAQQPSHRQGAMGRFEGSSGGVCHRRCPEPTCELFFSSLIYLPHSWQGPVSGSGFVGPFPFSEKRFCMGKSKNHPRPYKPISRSALFGGLGRGQPTAPAVQHAQRVAAALSPPNRSATIHCSLARRESGVARMCGSGVARMPNARRTTHGSTGLAH